MDNSEKLKEEEGERKALLVVLLLLGFCPILRRRPLSSISKYIYGIVKDSTHSLRMLDKLNNFRE